MYIFTRLTLLASTLCLLVVSFEVCALSTKLSKKINLSILEKEKNENFSSLKKTIESNQLGFLTLYNEEEVKDLKLQAQAYIGWKQIKLSSSQRVKIESECKKDKNINVFCPIILDSNYFQYNPPKRKKTNQRHHKAQMKKALNALRKNKVKGLDEFEERELMGAIKEYRSFKSLELLIKDLESEFKCQYKGISFLLAGKIEEYFPDTKIKNIAKSLYKKTIDCGESEYYSRALFRFGLISVWDKDFAAALEVFEALVYKSGDREYLSRSLYWISQVAQILDEKEKVIKAQKKLLIEAPLSVHTLLAHGEFPEAFQNYYFTQDSSLLFRSKLKENLNRDVLMIELMIDAKETYLARRMLQSRFDEFEKTENEFKLYLAYLYNRVDFYIEKFRLVAPLFKDKPEEISRASLELYFPYKKFNPKHFSGIAVNEYLALALIRQESAFNPRAHSAADARGLMQVLPKTARTVDRRVHKRQLFDEDINVRIGTKYFDRLIRQFDGDVESALMGYNAGALRVKEWNNRYPVTHSVLFLDLIPYKETREYVAAIARNYFWYATLYRENEIKKPDDFKMPESIRNKFKILDLKQTLVEK